MKKRPLTIIRTSLKPSEFKLSPQEMRLILHFRQCSQDAKDHYCRAIPITAAREERQKASKTPALRLVRGES